MKHVALFPVALSFLLATPGLSRADLVESFPLLLSAGSLQDNGTRFVSTKSGLAIDGVTFDATLTVQGSSAITGFSDPGTSGFGIRGLDQTFLLSNGEHLRFSLIVDNVSGGDIDFLGFSSISYSNVQSGAEIFVTPTLPVPNSATPVAVDGEGEVNLPSTAFTDFYSVAGPVFNGNRHLAGAVSARFSTALAAVPEPSGFLFGGLVSVLCGVLGRRRVRA